MSNALFTRQRIALLTYLLHCFLQLLYVLAFALLLSLLHKLLLLTVFNYHSFYISLLVFFFNSFCTVISLTSSCICCLSQFAKQNKSCFNWRTNNRNWKILFKTFL